MKLTKKVNKVLKRFFDVTFSIITLIVICIPFALVALLIFINDGRPIFFIQARPGLNNKIFKLYKFRTMSLDKNQFLAKDTLKSDGERITKLGNLLRKTSIDELPTLINVIKGDMSIVGPRPLLVHYLDLYDEHQIRRHEIKPGITGLAQVNGRNRISWEKKFTLDVWYVDNNNIFTDFKIIMQTIISVIRRKDVTDNETASSKPFTGNTK